MGRVFTPRELKAARARLGEAWGLGRPCSCAELGAALRLSGVDPGQSIYDYERGKGRITGPMTVAIELMLTGASLDDTRPKTA